MPSKETVEKISALTGDLDNEVPSDSLVIYMTALDEIESWVSGVKQIVLDIDGERHRYEPADVLDALRQIEL